MHWHSNFTLRQHAKFIPLTQLRPATACARLRAPSTKHHVLRTPVHCSNNPRHQSPYSHLRLWDAASPVNRLNLKLNSSLHTQTLDSGSTQARCQWTLSRKRMCTPQKWSWHLSTLMIRSTTQQSRSHGCQTHVRTPPSASTSSTSLLHLIELDWCDPQPRTPLTHSVLRNRSEIHTRSVRWVVVCEMQRVRGVRGGGEVHIMLCLLCMSLAVS